MPIPSTIIAGTEAEGSFQGRDRLFDRPGQEFTPAEIGMCAGLVAIEFDHRLVFRDGFLASPRLAQYVSPGVMRGGGPGRHGQSLCSQVFGARDISSGRIGHLIYHTAGKRVCKEAPRFGGLRVERQCSLEPVNSISVVVTGWRLRLSSASPENAVQRVGISGRPGGLCGDQLYVERIRDPACDLVLQGEQVGGLAIE